MSYLEGQANYVLDSSFLSNLDVTAGMFCNFSIINKNKLLKIKTRNVCPLLSLTVNGVPMLKVRVNRHLHIL